MTNRRAPKPEVAIEVPGTPEEVWRLIATGPGISTWFMPTTVEPHVGGTIIQRHGAGDDDISRGTISAYEPPGRLLYEEDFEGRTVATEFLVEARSGGSCVVRVVTHGLTADDAEFADGLISGWTQALATLRVHVAAFPGRPAGSARAWTRFGGSLDEAWREALARAGLAGLATGARVERDDVTGTVELVQDHAVLLRTEGPEPGVLSLIATSFGGTSSVVVDRYVYAEGDPQAAAETDLRAWEERLS